MDDKKGISDIFGVETIANVIDKSVKSIGHFLSLVSKPALEEFGFLLKDKVHTWRMNNLIKTLKKAEGKLVYENKNLEIHPKIALSIIENASMEEEEELQDMWAGLFAASCLEKKDDENLIFIDILKKITVIQARIIKYMCENSRIVLYKNGLFGAPDIIELNLEEIYEITKVDDVYRLDRELDHLRSLNLFASSLFGGTGGFGVGGNVITAKISPSALALYFYQKCMGSKDNPNIFWKDKIISEEDYNNELAANNFDS